jgi:hypothetical protein
MKKIMILLVLSCLVLSCSTTKKTSEKTTDQTSTSVSGIRDGSSYEKAIVIKEKSEYTGVDAEYTWLKQNYPGYKLKGQSINRYNSKPYDVLDILTAEGEEKSIYFDISNFYGKF